MHADTDIRDWLRQRGTETIEHPGGTLHAHLCRVHDRLTELRCPVTTQRAGLTHAAYSTDGFDVRLLHHTERATLRTLIGAEAEALTYLYGACDRDRTWATLTETSQVFDRFTGTPRTPAPGQLKSFVDLSIVNELDVMQQDPTLINQHGDYFRRLFTTWSTIASPTVTEAARHVLAGR